MKCSKCYQELEPGTKFCGNCGAVVIGSNSAEKKPAIKTPTMTKNVPEATTVLNSEPVKTPDVCATTVLSQNTATPSAKSARAAADPGATTVLSDHPIKPTQRNVSQGKACKLCGFNNTADADFCMGCGKPLAQPVATPIMAHPASEMNVGNFAPKESSAKPQQGASYQPAPAKICPACHKPCSLNETFCASCGQNLTMPYVPKCTKCGREYVAGEKFCPTCGTTLSNTKSSVSGFSINSIKEKWNSLAPEKRRNIIIISSAALAVLIILIVLLSSIHKCEFCDEWFFGKSYNYRGMRMDKDCYTDLAGWWY